MSDAELLSALGSFVDREIQSGKADGDRRHLYYADGAMRLVKQLANRHLITLSDVDRKMLDINDDLLDSLEEHLAHPEKKPSLGSVMLGSGG